MVFDNADGADEIDLLDDFWPSGARGSVLITTRNKEVLGQFTGTIHRLEKFGENEAIDLLIKLSHRESNKKDRENAAKICARVDYLPLAISATAIRIDTDEITFSEFYEENTNVDLIKQPSAAQGPETRYQHSLSTVWGQNFDRLEFEARQLLCVLAFLDPDKIQEILLSEGAQKSRSSEMQFIRTPKRFSVHRSQICRSGLVDRNPDLKQLWMHRLVSDDCQIRMTEETSQTAFRMAFEIVKEMWPVPERHNRHDRALWEVQQEYVQHIMALAQHYRQSHLGDEYGEFYPPLEAPLAFAELLYNGAW